MMKIRLGYLDNQLESRMLVNLGKEHPVENLNQVVDGYQIPELARRIWDVNVDQTVRDYIVQLVVATREHPSLVLGASPRGSHALYRAAQAQAALKNRDYVLPDDVKQLATVVLAHRCIIHPESALPGLSMDSIITGIVNDTALDIGKLTSPIYPSLLSCCWSSPYFFGSISFSTSFT
jgi:MoxR-like ATPase